MKSLTKLSIALLPILGVCAANAAPLVSLGDNVDLYINSKVAARYESNVLNAPINAEEDVVLVFSPGFELVAGRPGETAFSGRLLYRHHFLVYTDMDELDEENADASFNGAYNSGRLSFKTGVVYYETQSNQGFLTAGGDILPGSVDRDIYAITNYGEYEISNKTSVGLGYNINGYNYDAFGYTDYRVYSLPVDFYYALTPKMDVSIGYRHRQTNTTGAAPDSKDNFFNVGIRGELAPKTTGTFRIGYQERDVDGFGSEDDISFGGSLSYEVSPLAVVHFSLDRDYYTSATTGNTTERTGGTIAGTYAFSPVLSGSARLGYFHTDYEDIGREDDYYNFGVSLSYSPNDYVQLTAGYVYNNNDSSSAPVDFENNILEFSALFRY